MISFNAPAVVDQEIEYIVEALKVGKLSGDGPFAIKCQDWFVRTTGCVKALLTPSCTHALELAAILVDIKPGDEVIMPSYTFVSTANAFVLRGAKIVFVDIRPDTMNIDENKIEQAITSKTKVIVPVHYAGIPCEMDYIMELADRYSLFVIEDAAQGMMSTYKGRALGSIGHLGTYSFHETKNYTSGGEGGLLLINDSKFVNRAEIVREKGTNRSQFFRGMINKYTWVDVGSSLLPSEIQSAYLYAQLQSANVINEKRILIWDAYYTAFQEIATKGLIKLPVVPGNTKHNAHMFYLKLRDIAHRSKFIEIMALKGIMCVFHYIPLHSSPAGKEFGTFVGKDIYTTKESESLVRLPIYFNMSEIEMNEVIHATVTTLYELG